MTTAFACAVSTSAAPSFASEDPVLVAIETHRRARAAVERALKQSKRLQKLRQTEIDLDALVDGPCDVEWEAVDDLLQTVPTTASGLSAALEYYEQMMEAGHWQFDERQHLTMIASLAAGMRALERTL